MDEFVECLKETSSTNCGKEAGDWIYTAKQIYFAPTKKQLNCSDTGMYQEADQCVKIAFYRAKRSGSGARYCQGKLSVCLSVCL